MDFLIGCGQEKDGLRMAGQEDQELKMALRMGMQHEPPEPKRSKPRENSAGVSGRGDEESAEIKNRRIQQQLMVAAAERRMMAMRNVAAVPIVEKRDRASDAADMAENLIGKDVKLGEELSVEEPNQLFLMVFGSEITRGILAQWSNQGIRFSPDPETSTGLVQHEELRCLVWDQVDLQLGLSHLMILCIPLLKRLSQEPWLEVCARFCFSVEVIIGL